MQAGDDEENAEGGAQGEWKRGTFQSASSERAFTFDVLAKSSTVARLHR